MPDWPIKLNLNVTFSSETADKMAGALMDLVSPATQSAGMLGDYIGYRRRVLARILEEGLCDAQETGEEIKPPPPKFLLEFADKASREDLESELMENWVKLLSNAVLEYDSSLQTYIQILSQIGPREARVLSHLAGGTRGSYMQGLPHSFLTMARKTLQKRIPSELIEVPEKADKLIEEIFSINLLGPLTITSAEIITDPFKSDRAQNQEGGENKHYADFNALSQASSLYQSNPLSFGVLESYRLIEIHKERFYSVLFGEGDMTTANVYIAEVTPLGLDFLARCMGRDQVTEP